VTASELVFVGVTNDRNFRAFAAKSVELVWEQKTNSGIMGMPMSYEVHGTQYHAVYCHPVWLGCRSARIQDALTTQNVEREKNWSGCLP
jgi:alcohol dehydrogenase (cytochrome c)